MVNNNNNSVKQALDEKITELFNDKTYDLIVHFKGFDNLFENGVYNGKEKVLNYQIYNDSQKDKHIENIAKEYISQIKKFFSISRLFNKKFLLVWDGDDLGKYQWTRVMIATAEKLKNKGSEIEFLCIPENKDKSIIIQNKLLEIPELKETEIKFILQNEINIQRVGREVAGMCNMYVTSNINRTPVFPILVFCAGGGDILLNEYKFMKKQFVIPDWENDETKRNIYKNVIDLAYEDMSELFIWKASSLIYSRLKQGNILEESKMNLSNGIYIIDSNIRNNNNNNKDPLYQPELPRLKVFNKVKNGISYRLAGPKTGKYYNITGPTVKARKEALKLKGGARKKRTKKKKSSKKQTKKKSKKC